MSEPKNPKDMTDEERDALPSWDEYNKATAIPKKVKLRGIADDDIYAFWDKDGIAWHPVLYDGVWYKL